MTVVQNLPTPSVDLPGIGTWPLPGEPRRASQQDRSGRAGGPGAHLLTGAQWITFPVETAPPKAERPAYEFRTTLRLAAQPTTATLSATAHGIYEAFINGRRVGDHELSPGTSAYHSTLYVQTHDVTELLRPGVNDVRLVLSRRLVPRSDRIRARGRPRR